LFLFSLHEKSREIESLKYLCEVDRKQIKDIQIELAVTTADLRSNVEWREKHLEDLKGEEKKSEELKNEIQILGATLESTTHELANEKKLNFELSNKLTETESVTAGLKVLSDSFKDEIDKLKSSLLASQSEIEENKKINEGLEKNIVFLKETNVRNVLQLEESSRLLGEARRGSEELTQRLDVVQR
jgi:chromosome segregation ATPase